MKIAFVHPDLGIGGAERLVVDAAVGLQNKKHKVVIFTSYHDRKRCFKETLTLPVFVRGSWIPRSLFGKFHVLFAILKNLVLAFYILFRVWTKRDNFDLFIVDQMSACVPILKLSGVNVLFYCHFPDQLLTTRASLIKKLYRIPMDILEETTTSILNVM